MAAQKRQWNRQFLIQYCMDHNIEYDTIADDVKINRETLITGKCLHDLCNNKFSKRFICIVDRGGAYCDICTKKNSIELRKQKRTKPVDEFIREANETHKNTFTYDKVIYVNTHTKVKITCKKHGDFDQEPANHLSGNGCPACRYDTISIKLRLTKEEFIARANEVHSGLYSYGKVEYVNYDTPVLITCKEHGDFSQTPASHLSGNGCQECSGLIKLTQEEFIRKSSSTHKNKYDYSLVDYKSRLEHVTIICPIHGEFSQTPKNHMRGNGCMLCGLEIVLQKNKNSMMSKDTFLHLSEEIHNGKYDYKDVMYIDINTEVNINCPIHGLFKQLPKYHLRGGCIKCGGKELLTQEEVIERFVLSHGDLYDYSKVNYISCSLPVSIRCKLHDILFTQIPHLHYSNKTSCRECIQSKKIQNSLEKYGVEYPMHVPEIAERSSKSAYSFYDYIFPSGRIDRIQGTEKYTIDHLLSIGIHEDDIITKRTEVPEVWWFDAEGKKHRYYVDTYIKSQQLCIESKATYTAEQKGKDIFIKQYAVKQAGYRCEIWIYDRKGNKVECHK
jgi:hypothetical protein